MNEKIRKLAEKYHAGQFREGEAHLPYIVHPRAVVRTLLAWGEPETSPAVAAAWGHDLLEDTAVTEDEIRESAGDRVLAGIRVLTKPEGMEKSLYIRAVAASGDREVLSEVDFDADSGEREVAGYTATYERMVVGDQVICNYYIWTERAMTHEISCMVAADLEDSVDFDTVLNTIQFK